MMMNELITKRKPEEDKLIISSIKPDEVVINDIKVDDYLCSFKNNGEMLLKKENKEFKTEEPIYLNYIGFEYFRSFLRSELYTKMSEIFTEEWRNNEIGRKWHEEYSPEILDDCEESRIGLFKVLSKEKKQGMCR